MQPTTSTSAKVQCPSRELLSSIARREATLELRGNGDKAGPAIERYLAVFRDALNKNCETTRYSDPAIGYSWCCAFVYYCCLQAGFRFPPKPVPSYRYTLAAVPAWHHWAVTEGFFHPGDRSEPGVGDVVLFNHVDSEQPLDHIGVAVEIAPGFVRCSEGSIEDRTGLFERSRSCIAGYVRLPEIAS